MDTKPSQIELTCDQALEIVSASFDGEASLSEIDALASHLVACRQCRLAAEALGDDDDQLRRLGSRSMGGDRTTPPMRSPSRRWLLATAAALVLAVLTGLLTTLSQQTETTIATRPDSVSEPTAVAEEDLDAELDRLTAQAETLIARFNPSGAGRGNPFRPQRFENPFTDSRF